MTLRALAIVREKGLRLVYKNIKERIVFDWINGIDTITQVPKSDFDMASDNLSHGLHYSSSWTSEIKFGFHATRKHLKGDFEQFKFVDIGCGKGKVPIVWKQLLDRYKLVQAIYGIDYYDILLKDARENFRKVMRVDGTFIHSDATQFDYASIGSRLIVYLFHPFDHTVLERVVDAFNAKAVIIIYNNPVHEDVLLAKGFTIVAEKRGFHPQGVTVVYQRTL